MSSRNGAKKKRNRNLDLGPADFDWKGVEYFYDVYSSHLGYHFIVWRPAYSNQKDYEIVCHRPSFFPTEDVAFEECWKWMRKELDTAIRSPADAGTILHWLHHAPTRRSKARPTRTAKAAI